MFQREGGLYEFAQLEAGKGEVAQDAAARPDKEHHDGVCRDAALRRASRRVVYDVFGQLYLVAQSAALNLS